MIDGSYQDRDEAFEDRLLLTTFYFLMGFLFFFLRSTQHIQTQDQRFSRPLTFYQLQPHDQENLKKAQTLKKIYTPRPTSRTPSFY